jgi:mono/diheme cytochrome c family protein
MAGRLGIAALLAVAVLGACRQDMHDQPRLEVYESSTFFPDGRAQRPSVPGTVARGELFEDAHLHTGKVDGEFATEFPFPVDRAVLERGRERYSINCSPCHDSLGDGNGMIVQRGMKRPASFHEQRLRESPPGYFFDVITNGYGVMYDYADRVSPRDRWAIVAYVRVLQRSRAATLADVPAAERALLEERPR